MQIKEAEKIFGGSTKLIFGDKRQIDAKNLLNRYSEYLDIMEENNYPTLNCKDCEGRGEQKYCHEERDYYYEDICDECQGTGNFNVTEDSDQNDLEIAFDTLKELGYIE